MEHYAAQGGSELAILSNRETGTRGAGRGSARLLRTVMPFDIVLVDDHKLVRDGVKTILERGAEFHVVAKPRTERTPCSSARKRRPIWS